MLNNSTFYHLKSFIALPIQMICPANLDLGGAGVPPQVSPLASYMWRQLFWNIGSLLLAKKS